MFRVEFRERLHRPSPTVREKMRMHRIRILPVDKVQVEITPYDMTRGRIHLSLQITSKFHQKVEKSSNMKVRASVKPICEKVQSHLDGRTVRVICGGNPRHKQRQG